MGVKMEKNCPMLYFVTIAVVFISKLQANSDIVYNSTDQSLIDYIAENAEIRYDVISNFVDMRNTFTSKITIKNTGSLTIAYNNWEIYFYAIRLVQPNEYPYKEGFKLHDCKMRLYHVAGSLYKLCPERNFRMELHDVVECKFVMKYWQSAKTDTMPNWYVWAEGLTPRDIESTQGETLTFVGPFERPEQYQRYADDGWSPFTPESRFKKNDELAVSNVSEKLVIPTPVEMNMKSGSVKVDSSWTVVNSTKYYKVAKLIAEHFGLTIRSTKPQEQYIEITEQHDLNPLNVSTTVNEAYLIQISSQYITVAARAKAGMFYAYQTLKSIYQSGKSLPLCVIKDQPRFAYRGMHLDVGRNFHSKEEILKILETMAMYKLNKFHFHLTEDEGWRLEIPGIPELTEIGSKRCHDLNEDTCLLPQLGSGSSKDGLGSGFYTTEDYKEILRYANDRNIQVIPEIDMPGHCRAGIKALEARYRKFMKIGNEVEANKYLLTDFADKTHYLTVQWFYDNAINICMNSTAVFIRHLITSLIEMHQDIQPLNMYHFGGDEVAGAWKESPECKKFLSKKGLNDTATLKRYFAHFMSNLTNDEGLHMAVWADALKEGNALYNISAFPTKQNIIAYNWDNLWERGHGDKAYKLANAGYKVVLSHATHLYFDHPYEPDTEERGYYWATRFTDTRKTFGYIPDDIFYNADKSRDGHPLTKDQICPNNECLKLEKPENIIGIQGQVWTETIRTSQQLHEMMFPRMLALAERAWHKSEWEQIPDKQRRIMETNKEWASFSKALVEREFPRLDGMGIKYRVPVPGARVSGDVLQINSAFPGLGFQYSLDNQQSWLNVTSQEVHLKTNMYLRTRSSDGYRYSRSVFLRNVISSDGDHMKPICINIFTATIFCAIKMVFY